MDSSEVKALMSDDLGYKADCSAVLDDDHYFKMIWNVHNKGNIYGLGFRVKAGNCDIASQVKLAKDLIACFFRCKHFAVHKSIDSWVTSMLGAGKVKPLNLASIGELSYG